MEVKVEGKTKTVITGSFIESRGTTQITYTRISNIEISVDNDSLVQHLEFGEQYAVIPSLNITNSSFNNILMSNQGNVLKFQPQDSRLIMNDVEFVDCTAHRGGAIYLIMSGSINCKVEIYQLLCQNCKSLGLASQEEKDADGNPIKLAWDLWEDEQAESLKFGQFNESNKIATETSTDDDDEDEMEDDWPEDDSEADFVAENDEEKEKHKKKKKKGNKQGEDKKGKKKDKDKKEKKILISNAEVPVVEEDDGYSKFPYYSSVGLGAAIYAQDIQVDISYSQIRGQTGKENLVFIYGTQFNAQNLTMLSQLEPSEQPVNISFAT
ncbi:MAG: hypothetical protein EZS28_035269, partial [Streblomastix strix]